MTRVVIFGSCVTRDAFEVHATRLGKPHEYFARSWLASALETRPIQEVDTSTIASAFQRRMVEWDLTGEFAAYLARGEFDLLVMDFVDERFDLAVTPGGAAMTKSNELRSATVPEQISANVEVVKAFSDQHFEMWQNAWRTLLQILDDHGMRARLRINAVYWAWSPDLEFPAMYARAKVKAANAFLERLYDRIREDLSDDQIFYYPKSALRPASEHKWGLAPFHYCAEYYDELANHIAGAAASLGTEVGPEQDASVSTLVKDSKSPQHREPDHLDQSSGMLRRMGTKIGRSLRRALPQLRRSQQRAIPERLVISYLYPPTAETSGYVVAKRIRQWDVPVDVIASSGDTGRVPDPSAAQIAGDQVHNVIRVLGGKHELANWSICEDFTRLGIAAIEDLRSQGRKYREVYSRSMVPASHILAATMKLQDPDLQWIAEFSDPLRLDTHGEHREASIPDSPIAGPLIETVAEAGFDLSRSTGMFDLVEFAVYVLADTIVFTNPNQREVMLRNIDDESMRASVRSRSRVWPHPVPDASLYRATEVPLKRNSSRLHFAYFGVFYGARSAQDLIDVFGSLDQDERSRVRLDVYVDKPKRTRQAVREAELSDVVRVRPLVPYLSFLNLTTKYDWLIVTDAHTSEAHTVNPYVPSKLADYRGSGTPIWAMAEAGSLLSQDESIKRTRIGDTDAATAFIRSQLK